LRNIRLSAQTFPRDPRRGRQKCRVWLHRTTGAVLPWSGHAQPKRELQQLPFESPGSWPKRKDHLQTVKDCMLAIVDEVINDDKIKTSVTSAIKNVSMSDTSNIRRMEILARDVFETLLEDLRKAEVMSIAVDESTDKTDTAQLCIYVRFFDGNCFREELLGLLPLEGRTTGEILFEKICLFSKIMIWI